MTTDLGPWILSALIVLGLAHVVGLCVLIIKVDDLVKTLRERTADPNVYAYPARRRP